MIPDHARSVLLRLQPLADRFEAAGHRLYLVGGAVRDIFVGRESDRSNDMDLTTDATPDRIKSLISPLAYAVWSQGERFGTIGATIDGVDYEITTHRADAYEPDTRKPRVAFSTDINEDLSRRDFTINAMALEVTGDDPTLIDPYGGITDLHGRVLRTPLTPEVSFSDDPLRMMRAARFIARFELVPDPDLVRSATEMAERMSIVSAERIRDELCKLLVTDDPTAGLFFLNDVGLTQYFLPELPAMRLEQDPIHRHKDVLTHTIAVVRRSPVRLRVRLAALFHDIAKPATRAIGPNGVSFHHHEVVGARMTRERMRALRFDKESVRDVSQLVFLHLRGHGYGAGWSDSAVRRFVRDAGPLLDDLIALTRADCTTRNREKAARLSAQIDELERRIAELEEQEALAAIRPDLDGQDVMDHLGLPPGPQVGAALKHLLEIRLDQGPLDREAALAELDRWWVDQGADQGTGGGVATPGRHD